MNKIELKLWKQYCEEVDEENKKRSEKCEKHKRHMLKEYENHNKKLQKDYDSAINKLIQEQKIWDALPFWKKVFIQRPWKHIRRPYYLPMPGLAYPFIETPTYEKFLNWRVDRENI